MRMAKIVSLRKNVLLPFPEMQLEASDKLLVLNSHQATGELVTRGIVFGDQCRPYVRVGLQERTSNQAVAAELVERFEFGHVMREHDTFCIEIECLRSCLFVAALVCSQRFDP